MITCKKASVKLCEYCIIEYRIGDCILNGYINIFKPSMFKHNDLILNINHICKFWSIQYYLHEIWIRKALEIVSPKSLEYLDKVLLLQ